MLIVARCSMPLLQVKSEGEVKELPAAGETPKGVHDTPLPSDDAEAAVQVVP